MKKERVRSKHGFKGFGVFILGWFLGLISTLGILVGVGYWAYTSLNIKKIEKWTKSDITNNKGLESLTLEKVVSIVQGINKNGNNDYSLAQLEEDFNLNLLDNSIYGIDLTKLKTSSLKNLKEAFDDTIDSITFNNVLSFMETDTAKMGVLNTILENNLTYYLNDGKLYEKYDNNEYSVEVDFKYTIKYDTQNRPIGVEFANGSHTISLFDGVYSIKPRLCDLPLNNAVESMTDATMGLKIYQLLDYERTGTEGNYEYTKDGDKMSGVMASLAEYTIDDLADQNKLNNIYIYEVMGYKALGNGEFSYINSSNQEIKVTGAMKTIASMTIGEISNPETINTLKIYEVMGYYENEGKYYKTFDGTNYTDEITGTMKTLAGKTLNELSDPNFVNNLQVWEVMGFEQTGEEGSYVYLDNGKEISGIMATLAENKISELDNAGTFNDVTVADAMGYYYNSENETYYRTYDETNGYTNPVTGIYAHIASAKVSALSERINTLQVGQVLDMDIEDTNGVIKALYGLKIEDLSNKDTINNIYVWQVMDYTQVIGGGYTYDKNGTPEEVTGAMKVLADKTIGELSNPATINGLKIYELLGYYEHEGKYYKNYNVDTNTYTDEMEGVIKAFAGMLISELNDDTNGIKSINLIDILEVDINDADTPAIIKALSTSTIGSLNTDISALQVYKIMGYYENGGKYYKNYDAENQTYTGEVTGIMGAIAGTNANNIGSTIEGLTAAQVLGADSKLLKIFDENDRGAILVTELSDRLATEMGSATVGELVDSGLIELSEAERNLPYYKAIQGYNIKDIITGNFIIDLS